MASMFHLFTHAMFKALLFLGAGSIIHAVHSNEMSAMGGLRKYMPITHWTFLIACLAIAGIPPFSGFFSKDEILAACFQYSPVMGWVMTVIAAMTAFYMFRLYYGIFWGKENKELHAHHTPHESPLAMTFPLMFLAVVTCGAGFIPFDTSSVRMVNLILSISIRRWLLQALSLRLFRLQSLHGCTRMPNNLLPIHWKNSSKVCTRLLITASILTIYTSLSRIRLSSAASLLLSHGSTVM